MKKSKHFKKKSYASYQFFTMASLIVFSIALTQITANLLIEGSNAPKTLAEWGKHIQSAMSFSSSENVETMSFAGILIYISIGLFIFGFISSIPITRIKEKNIFDTLFLSFWFIPMFGNLFAFFAQMASKETVETFKSDASIEKKEVKLIEKNISNKIKQEKNKVKNSKPIISRKKKNHKKNE